MEEEDENERFSSPPDSNQNDNDDGSSSKTVKTTKDGRWKKKTENGDIQKLVRSEVKRIMEAQHQSMMSMLDTAGTLVLRNLQPITNGQETDSPNESSSSNNVQSCENKGDQLPQVGHVESVADGPSNATEARRVAGAEMERIEDKVEGSRDSVAQVETDSDGRGVTGATQTNGVPPLRLEDLASSRDSAHWHGDQGQVSGRNIPGMIRGFPLLTIPKDAGIGRERGVGVVGSEYDLVPTRERDSARVPQPGRENIVLLRVEPEQTGLPPRRDPVEPPLYKKSAPSRTQTHREPSTYQSSGTQPHMIGNMPLLRIIPEKDYHFRVPQHSNLPYSQMAQPRMHHQTSAPPHPIGQYGAPGHTPREAWVNPPSRGTNPTYPLQGKIDIPLLRIDYSKQHPSAPSLMHPFALNKNVQSASQTQTERTRIDLPLLRLKDPAPQPLLQANFQRPLQTKLPLVSPEEILAYQQEKRRRELEMEQECRRQNGAPMQLLHLESEPTGDVLATTSRQRRRERMETKENDPRTDLDQIPKKAKIRKSRPRTKGANQRKAGVFSKASDLVIKDTEDTLSSNENEEKEEERPRVPPRGRVVMVMPREELTSRQRSEEEEDEMDEEDMPIGVERRMDSQKKAVTLHDVETQVSALGGGYAIKPGSHDEALRDPDARPLLPTSAQIHYETVMKLQQPPQVVHTREAETQMKDVKETGTSMEGRIWFDAKRESLARGAPDIATKEQAKPTVEDVEEEYTRAVTGLNKAGNIIAPDIFFGLRFRSGQEQASSAAGADENQPDSAGREFIHVADINAEDLFRDIPHHADSKDYRGRRGRDDDNFQHPERDGSSCISPGEKGAKRRKEDATTPQEQQEEEDRTTIAELHHKSLFHRDAVPSDGLALLEEDEEGMDGAQKRKRIGDEVTRKLLEAKLEKAERGLKLQSEISSSRNQSKDRIQHQLARMNERLGAIDEVSQSMQRDFNNTKLLLHTVENLSEAMVQPPADRQPRPDYSFKDYKDPKSDDTPRALPQSSDHHYDDDDAGQREEGKRNMDERKDDDKEEEEGEDNEKEDEFGDEDGVEDQEDGDDVDRTIVTEGNMTLGISGISGVSDIIAEVIAGDDADEFGLTEQQKRAAKKRVQNRHDSLSEDDLNDIPLASLTDKQLRQIFSPRSAPSPEEKPWPFAAKPEGRSAEERQRIKEWMERRRIQQIEEYKKKRGEKIEREPNPFRPKGDSLKLVPASTKEIKRAEEEKKTKRETKTKDHFEDRLSQAKDLMAEIFDEKPNLPQRRPLMEPQRDRSGKLRKQTTSSTKVRATPGQRQTQQPSSRTAATPQPPTRTAATPQPSMRTAATPQPRGGADSRMVSTRVLGDRSNLSRNDGRLGGHLIGKPPPKGTYMFIDSEAYRGPAVDHQGARNQKQEHPAFRTSSDRRPPQRSLQATLERSVQFADQRPSSEEDLQLVLAEMSDLVTPRSEEDEQENYHLESAAVTYQKPKSFKDIVRVQRPEVTRKREGTPRKSKTYTDMLQEMKAEVSSSRAPSSVKAKQRLYGSTRLPGWNKNRKQYAKTPKTYTERLAEMRGAKGRGGQSTRLVQRPKPRPRQEDRPSTATMTLGPSRRQQVERRGITPEPGPRSSTPYTAMLQELGNSGTLRGLEPVVSLRPSPGMRAKPRAHEPVPYVDRLKQGAAEAAAITPPRKYKTAYGTRPASTGARPIPTGTYYAHKAPPLRTPSPRHQPYDMGTRQPGRAEDEISNVSELSPWSVSDDVRRLLDEDDDHLDEGLPTIREPQYELSDADDQEYGDYAASVDIHELQELASVGSGSIMSNLDWDAIDKMIETVE